MRVTEDQVQEIAEVDASISLIPYITVANALVTELCTDSGYTDERLALIEMWLSAHFYLLRDQVAASEKAGSVSINYQYQIGLLFNQTKYGQTAMLLDTAGNLALLQKQIEKGSGAFSITWLGTSHDDE